MSINEYVTPSLTVLIPILYICGMAIKKSNVPDYKIPFILGGIGIVLANIWVFAENMPVTFSQALTTLFFGTSQGIVCAACSVYTKNLLKQYSEGKELNIYDDKTD